MKKFIIVLIVIALISCTNTKTNQENYSYTRINSASNYATIVFEDYDDFIKQVGNNREILLIKKNSDDFFGIKYDDEMYLLDSLGYKTLEDYTEGIKLNYKRSKDYYEAKSIGCNNSI